MINRDISHTNINWRLKLLMCYSASKNHPCVRRVPPHLPPCHQDQREWQRIPANYNQSTIHCNPMPMQEGGKVESDSASPPILIMIQNTELYQTKALIFSQVCSTNATEKLPIFYPFFTSRLTLGNKGNAKPMQWSTIINFSHYKTFSVHSFSIFPTSVVLVVFGTKCFENLCSATWCRLHLKHPRYEISCSKASLVLVQSRQLQTYLVSPFNISCLELSFNLFGSFWFLKKWSWWWWPGWWVDGGPYLNTLHSLPLSEFWCRLEPTSQLLKSAVGWFSMNTTDSHSLWASFQVLAKNGP